MDIQNAASVIKDTVDMETVIGLYGYSARHRKMVCPFHGDKNASLQIYANNGRHNGWHCFGCGRGGSVIDFVMEHDGCDFITAVKAIDHALGMGLLETADMFTIRKRKAEQEKYDLVREAFDAFYDELSRQLLIIYLDKFRQLRAIEEKDVPERTADEWTRLQTLPEDLQYIEYLQDKITENKRKVMAWRNRARRARSG